MRTHELGAPRWAEVHNTTTAQQHGVLGRWQAEAWGVASSTYSEHMLAHGWSQEWPGVWTHPGSPRTYEQQCWAALVALRCRAVLTATSALWVYGAIAQRPDDVALLIRPNRHIQVRPQIRLHRGRWIAGDAAELREGLPVAPVLRAWSDYARDHTSARLSTALSALDRLRLATPADAAAYVEARGSFHGRKRARSALAELNGELTHSGDERRARHLLRAAALPHAPLGRPFTVVHRGEMVAEIDLGWPRFRYGVEVDGPHHMLAEVLAADKARDRRLTQIGWVIDRFSTEEILARPDAFVRQVRFGLEAAIARRPIPWR